MINTEDAEFKKFITEKIIDIDFKIERLLKHHDGTFYEGLNAGMSCALRILEVSKDMSEAILVLKGYEFIKETHKDELTKNEDLTHDSSS